MFSQLLRMVVQVGGAHACQAKSQCCTSYFVTQKLYDHSLLATIFSQLITAAAMFDIQYGEKEGPWLIGKQVIQTHSEGSVHQLSCCFIPERLLNYQPYVSPNTLQQKHNGGVVCQQHI